MAGFKYLLVTPEGERLKGEVKAGDLESALKTLQEKGGTIVSVAPIEMGEGDADDLSARFQKAIHRIRTHIPLRNVAFFTRQLATMFSAGMTLERAVSSLASHEQHHKFRKTLLQIGKDIQKGRTLSDSMARHPGAFDSLYVSLVKSGEIGGSLSSTLERLADYLESSEDTRRKVISAMSYPAVVMAILAICVAAILLIVAPKFNKVYQSFGAELPQATQVLMGISDFLIAHSAQGLLVLLCLLAGLFLFSLTDRGRLMLDTLKLKIPVLGRLVEESVLARFARTFGLLLQASVPVLDSMDLAARVVSNVPVEKAVRKARDYIQEGVSIHRALERTARFPSVMIQLVATGEETGAVDDLLIKAAEFYEKQVDALISRLTSVIEPLLIVLMGAVVGTLVIIIYLPILYLGVAIKKGMG